MTDEGASELMKADDTNLYIRVYDNKEDYEDGYENDEMSDHLSGIDNVKDLHQLKTELDDLLKNDFKIKNNKFVRITRMKSHGDEAVVEYKPGGEWETSVNR